MKTKIINPFNKERRKIKCIANKHDYIGNGDIINEPDLIEGEIYTLVSVRQEPYGTMVFLKEVNSKKGFQSYLFEELVPHDEYAFNKNSAEWLSNELNKSVESKEKVKETLFTKLDSILTANFLPKYTEKHNYGNAYWIVPVKIKDKEKITLSDFEELSEHEISIEGEYFDLLLLDFFKNNLNSELNINKHRISTDFNPDGDFIKGFDWHLNPNFYTQRDLTTIFTELAFFKDGIKHKDFSSISETTKNKLLRRMEYSISKENITEEEFIHRIIVFYEKLIIKISEMFNYSNIICVIAP